jgi:hypothetical protein
MGVENLNLAQDNTGDENEALEPQHTVGEAQPVTDPAEDFETPDEVPGDHDDVDVALQDGKDTADGPGEGEVPPEDFVSYENPAAETQEDQN